MKNPVNQPVWNMRSHMDHIKKEALRKAELQTRQYIIEREARIVSRVFFWTLTVGFVGYVIYTLKVL